MSLAPERTAVRTNFRRNRFTLNHNIDGLAQDYSNSIANWLELLQPCTKPSMLWSKMKAAVMIYPDWHDYMIWWGRLHNQLGQ